MPATPASDVAVAGGRTRSGGLGPFLRVLHAVTVNKRLRRVSLAFLTFNSGEWATWIAMLVYAYAHGGATETGLVAVALLVPAAVLAPIVAAFGERHPPGRALFAGYAAQAVTCVLVAAALFADVTPLLAYALMVGPSIAFAMTRPTQAAFAPGLATTPEQLMSTNVVSGWIESISMLVAPVMAGVILSVSSPGAVFLVMGIACAVGGFLVAPLRDAVPASRSSTEDGEGFDSFWGGISLVKSDPQARMLVLMLGMQCVALGALDVLYVEVAQAVLHRGGAWAGYLSGAFGAGGVLAVAVTASLVGRRHLAKPLVLSLGVWSLTFFGLAALPGAIAALLLLGVAGGARATFDVTGRTLLQRVARPDLLARIFGLLEGLQMAGLALGSGLAPVLIALGGAKAALVGVGVILPLAAIADGRRLLDIDRHATVPIVEIALLRSIPLFAPLPPPTLESIARSLVLVSVPAGAEVIRQGEPGDRFYAIADGELDVSADGRFVTTLGRGTGFGEIALMYGVPRTATVTGRSDATLYALERDTFLVAVTGHTSARTIAKDLVDTRLEELRTLREGT